MTTQTRIADLVPNAGVLSNVVRAQFRAHNSITTSGIATTGPEVDLLMAGGSKVQRLNFVNKVDTDNYNHSNDDFDDKGPVGKISAAGYSALRQDLNWGWAYTDLVRMVTKYDIRGGLTSAIPLFWSEVTEKIAVNSMYGAIASDAALTIDAGTEEFSLEALIDAATDYDGDLDHIVVSRKGAAKLKKLNIIPTRAQGETSTRLNTFSDYNVIVSKYVGDDEMLIAGNGAVAFSTGLVPGEIGAEIGRDVNAGHGGGGEILRVRNSVVVAPQGMGYKAVKTDPTLADLRSALSWERVADRDFIAMRLVKFTA